MSLFVPDSDVFPCCLWLPLHTHHRMVFPRCSEYSCVPALLPNSAYAPATEQEEMKHRYKIRAMSFLSKNMNLMKNVSFALAIVINIIILLSFGVKVPSGDISDDPLRCACAAFAGSVGCMCRSIDVCLPLILQHDDTHRPHCYRRRCSHRLSRAGGGAQVGFL